MRYKRILLKLSGESLQGDDNFGINPQVLEYFCSQAGELSAAGIETAIVIGGGNIFRGLAGIQSGFDRVKGDQMGMLATVINSLALESEFHRQKYDAMVFTSTSMAPVGELYVRDTVIEMMKKGTICILAGGTGNPFFTTDTAAALRAVETGSDVLLKGTRVDGIYNEDPEKSESAVKYESITYAEAIQARLKIMDQTAFTMCSENDMPILVFNMNVPGNLLKAARGERIGTLVSGK